MPWLVRARASAVGSFLLGSTLTAHADGTSPVFPITLDWHAPSGCPSSDDVASALRRFLPEPPSPSSERSTVRIEVVREDEMHWQVMLTWMDGTAARRRSFTAENCRAAAEASALVVALALRAPPGAAGEHDAATAKPLLTAEPDDEVLERALSITPRSHDWAAGVSAVGDVGDLPNPRPGFGVSLRVAPVPHWRSVRLGGSLAIFAPGSTESGPAGGRFWLATASAEACVEPAVGLAQLGGCAVAEGALLDGHGVGQTESTTSRVGDWLLLGLRGAGEIPIASGWSVRAELGPAVGVGRPTFQAAGGSSQGTVIFRPGLIVGRAALGAEAHF